VNAWLLAALVLLPLGLGPCLWVSCRGPAAQRLAGANLAAVLTTVLFLLLAQGFGRSSYVDLALVLAVLAPAGTLVFARLLAADPETRTAPPSTGEAL
jgi:multisubunit Na+/H+ antiporter MnhF subunit